MEENNEYMTNSEAIEKLRAYIKCQILQVKGIYEDCNNKRCDDCDLCYMQGTTGEHRTAIGIAIQALEKQIQKKPKERDCIGFDTLACPECKKSLYLYEPYCDNCGQAIDWNDE